MGGGYVLDFSNQTFAEFFADELGVDIDFTRVGNDTRWHAAERQAHYGPLLRSSPASTVRENAAGGCSELRCESVHGDIEYIGRCYLDNGPSKRRINV